MGYFVHMANSADMNIWLHKQVMIKLAENGGKVRSRYSYQPIQVLAGSRNRCRGPSSLNKRRLRLARRSDLR